MHNQKLTTRVNRVSLSLSRDLCTKAFEISNGHPLALIYLLREIQQITPSEERLTQLRKTKCFENDIENLYWSHWQKIEKDKELVFALGLLCRTRGAIPMQWVATWAEDSVLQKIQDLSTYFDKDSQDRWNFFHNSFRLFLIDKTGEPLVGQARENREQEFHQKIAHLYEDAEIPWCWETLYHYNLAEEHHIVTTLSTWDWFLNQITSLRPLDAVQIDIRLATKSAGKCKDVVLLSRLTLLSAAIEQRSSVLDDFSISDILLECGEPGIAADHIRDGNKLRINAEQALTISTKFLETGLKREAYRIFELSEPQELLSGRIIPDDNNRPDNLWNLLTAWVRSAILFRNAEEIINTIKRIRTSPRRNSTKTIEVESLALQNWLLFQGSLACSQKEDWDNWQLFFDALNTEQSQPVQMFALLRSVENAQENGNLKRVEEFLPQLISRFPSAYLNELENEQWRVEACISYAQLLSNIEEYKQDASIYIRELQPIPLYDPRLDLNEKPTEHELRFRLARLRYWFGESQTPNELLKSAESNTNFHQNIEENDKQGYRTIALATYTTARLWGLGKQGNYLSSASFLQETKWIVDLFGTNWKEWTSQSHLYIPNIQFDILEFVIVAAKQHGNEVLIALKNDFESRWLDAEEGKKWWIGLQRDVISNLAIEGVDRNWVKRQLIRIAPTMLQLHDPYGKAEECTAQAKAWLIIDEPQEAIQEIKKRVDAARGILNDKDYQLVEWIKWLGHINEIEQIEQGQRISLMLRRIVSIQDTASGISIASKELLGIMFKYSPRRSIYLLKYMLENNLVTHQEGIAQLLQAALDTNDPPYKEITQTLLSLVFPFVLGSEPQLVETLINNFGKKMERQQTINFAQNITDHLLVDALADTRFEWIQGIIKGLKQVGISKDHICIDVSIKEKKDYSTTLDRHLYLINGDQLSLSNVLISVTKLEELENLLENEDVEKTQYFEWISVAEHLIQHLSTNDEINKLQSVICTKLSENYSKESNLVRLNIALSKRYVELGYLDLAWNCAEQARKHSDSSSWASYWGQSHRLDAIRQLKAIDPDRVKDFVFDLYANDLSKDSYNSLSFILYLFEILEVICDDIPISKIWSEIECFLNDLFISESVKETLEFDFDPHFDFFEEDNPQMAFLDLMVLYLTFPSYPVAQGAVRGLANLLQNDVEGISIILNLSLSSDDDLLIQRSLMILDAVSISVDDPDRLSCFLSQLDNLCLSPNFAIRLIASKIIARIKNSTPKIAIAYTELPSIYQLQLPEISFHETSFELEDNQTPILIGDPARIIRPLDREMQFIAKMSNLPIENILLRAKQLFKQFAINQTWLTDDKQISGERLQTFLQHAGTILAHNKPNIFVAEQALRYIIGELWDSEYLNKNCFGTILLMLSKYDPEFILCDPEKRPKCIGPIGSSKNEDSYNKFAENWLEEANASFQFMSKSTEGEFIILGEKTNLKFLQTDWPSEIRYSVIKAIEENSFWPTSNQEFSPFYREKNLLTQDYFRIEAPINQTIVNNVTFGFETLGANWIALNPSLAKSLGWEFEPVKRWFQWVDASGNLVAKSVWWRDGCIDQFNRFERIEVGEGWLVLITKSGLDEIKKLLGYMNRGCHVIRALGWLGGKGTKSVKQFAPLE